MPQFDWKKLLRKESVWAVLFIVFLYWVMTANDTRELRYINMIDTLNKDVKSELLQLKAMHRQPT